MGSPLTTKANWTAGIEFGQDFIPFLRSCGMPKQPRLFEWCSGPGFIGFSMLGHGLCETLCLLCETLCLADINPAAVRRCQNTVRLNHLEDRVSVYRSNNLNERWNLVVSNPPHFIDQYEGDVHSATQSKIRPLPLPPTPRTKI